MNSNTKRIILLILGLILLTGAAIAVISSLNFKLGNYQLSSSGGRIGSASYSSNVSCGQNVTGSCESASFKIGTGYISNITGTTVSSAKENLQEMYVYPNPYKPGSGGDYDADYITFSNLTRQAKIEVFNIAGELVATINKDSYDKNYQWDATNDAGERLASGVYIFYVSNDNDQKKKGKFAIIR